MHCCLACQVHSLAVREEHPGVQWQEVKASLSARGKTSARAKLEKENVVLGSCCPFDSALFVFLCGWRK